MAKTLLERWHDDDPRRPPAAYACIAARARRAADPFVRTVPLLEEGAVWFLAVEPELAHALVLVLAQLPAEERPAFADCFYAERGRATAGELTADPERRLAVAAGVALLVVELTGSADLQGARVLDLLHGAAQGDDLSALPEPAREELRKAVARVRLDVDLDDELDPRAAASIAVVETIDPSSGAVDVQEVLCRAAWAALRTGGRPRALAFLLAADRIFAAA